MFHPRKRKNCHINATVVCMEHFMELLEPFRGGSVLMSDESMASKFQVQQLSLMKQELQDWTIVIAVGYRRFFDWLKSNHFQRHRLDFPWESSEAWPGQGYGRHTELLFPDIVHRWREIAQYSKFTTHIMQAAQVAGVQVRVLNLEQETLEHEPVPSIRTLFLCEVLPEAPHACRISKQQDGETEPLHMNTRDRVLHFNYDILTTRAAEAGLVDTTVYTRREVRMAVQAYQEEELGLTPFDFALICPSQQELDLFLQESLDLERQVFDNADEMQAAHRQAFMERVNAKEYCRPDVDTILSQETWKNFFADYAISLSAGGAAK